MNFSSQCMNEVGLKALNAGIEDQFTLFRNGVFEQMRLLEMREKTRTVSVRTEVGQRCLLCLGICVSLYV